MSYISIVTRILGGFKLAEDIKDTLNKAIPSPPKELENKYRSMQCTVKNATQFSLQLKETYFDSGTYWDAPGGASPFGQNVFSICNKDNSVFTGASGGTTFQIKLDNTHTFDFAIGWTSPGAGGYKAGVTESTSAKDGYNVASLSGNSIVSTNKYEGLDKDGEKKTFEFQISAAPGHESLYVVTQIML